MLSIVVPIYNVEEYLRKSITCLLEQSYREIEVILVDDGSTDSSGRICDDFQKKDSRIKVIHKENGGVATAWKTGVLHANGEFIGFLDPDDYCEKDYFEKFMTEIMASDADQVIGGYTIEYQNRSVEFHIDSVNYRLGLYQGENLEQLKEEYFKYETHIPWVRWAQVIRRSIIVENLKYVDETIKMGDDIGIAIADFFDLNKLVLIENVGYHYVQRESSIVHTLSKNLSQNFNRLCDNMELICREKRYDGFVNRAFISQLLTMLSVILRTGSNRKEKIKHLKELRKTDAVHKIFSQRDFGTYSPKKKIALWMFKHKLFGLLTLSKS